MGNLDIKLSWSWPLVCIEWIPEILSSFEYLIEPSWEGLQRQMISHVFNKSFGKRSFHQLQNLLRETRLVEEQGRFIKPTVKADSITIRNHLSNIYRENSHSWANFFNIIYKNKSAFNFSNFSDILTKHWPDIKSYSVFKQWAEYFQFIGLGFLVKWDFFIPESAINPDDENIIKLIEKCLKTPRDPRILTGHNSLHTKADFFAWTKGEDHIPISDDRNLFPRIPLEVIMTSWYRKQALPGTLFSAIQKGIEEWQKSINQTLSNYPFGNISKVIFTGKYLLDYFLFGRSEFFTDFLDPETLFLTKKRWESVKHFTLSQHTWKTLPNLFKNITRLFWGLTYYRDNLKRPILYDNLYDESIFTFRFKDLNNFKPVTIRCFRSKITLQFILKSLLSINKALTKPSDSKTLDFYRMETEKIQDQIMHYLPSDPLDLIETIENAERLIDLTPEEKKLLLKTPRFDIKSGCPFQPLLKKCFWIHRYHEFNNSPQTKILLILKKRMALLEKKLIREMNYYENGLNEWNETYLKLRKQIQSVMNSQ